MSYIIKEEKRNEFRNVLLNNRNSRIDTSNRSIENKDDILKSLMDIYYHKNTLWAHARDGRGKHAATSVHPYFEREIALLNKLSDMYYDYFNNQEIKENSEDEFDFFHELLCDTFFYGINEIRRDCSLVNISYGQAQKLINLTFKYLTTYSDYLKFAPLFKNCHMVLDSIVLGNLHPNKLSLILGSKPMSKIKGLYGSSYNGHGWTSMSKDDYYKLVKAYRNMLSSYLGLHTYMEIEYHMWPSCDRL